jgi:transposase
MPLLPPQKPKTGRPAVDHRRILNGILWFLRTGAPWRDLPERYGPWPTVYSRLQRWQAAGIWDRPLAVIQQDSDAAGELDWDIHYVDSTIGSLLPRSCRYSLPTQPRVRVIPGADFSLDELRLLRAKDCTAA